MTVVPPDRIAEWKAERAASPPNSAPARLTPTPPSRNRSLEFDSSSDDDDSNNDDDDNDESEDTESEQTSDEEVEALLVSPSRSSRSSSESAESPSRPGGGGVLPSSSNVQLHNHQRRRASAPIPMMPTVPKVVATPARRHSLRERVLIRSAVKALYKSASTSDLRQEPAAASVVVAPAREVRQEEDDDEQQTDDGDQEDVGVEVREVDEDNAGVQANNASVSQPTEENAESSAFEDAPAELGGGHSRPSPEMLTPVVCLNLLLSFPPLGLA
jgi:hypothetical protein